MLSCLAIFARVVCVCAFLHTYTLMQTVLMSFGFFVGASLKRGLLTEDHLFSIRPTVKNVYRKIDAIMDDLERADAEQDEQRRQQAALQKQKQQQLQQQQQAWSGGGDENDWMSETERRYRASVSADVLGDEWGTTNRPTSSRNKLNKSRNMNTAHNMPEGSSGDSVDVWLAEQEKKEQEQRMQFASSLHHTSQHNSSPTRRVFASSSSSSASSPFSSSQYKNPFTTSTSNPHKQQRPVFSLSTSLHKDWQTKERERANEEKQRESYHNALHSATVARMRARRKHEKETKVRIFVLCFCCVVLLF